MIVVAAMDTADTPLLLSSSHDGKGEEEDGKPVTSVVRSFGIESKKLWKIAGPTIVTAICQYSLGALTQTFAGFVGELELAAVAVENSVVAGLAFGVMVSKLLMSSTYSAIPVLLPLFHIICLLIKPNQTEL